MTELFSPALLHTIQALSVQLRQRGWMLATAESCTGGLIAAACTELAGSSDWFECGLISYSNTAKTELLGVSEALIARHGAVSEPVARAMAEGALRRARAQCSLAVTGVAGPGGGSAEKPVGTVCFAWSVLDCQTARSVRTHAQRLQLDGDRQSVRRQTLQHALNHLLMMLTD